MKPPEPTFSNICSRVQIEDPAGFFHGITHVLKNTYRMNGDRHDESVGDDRFTFGCNMYRNSWAQVAREVQVYRGGTTARPEGSLVIYTGGPRIKMYKGGSDKAFNIYDYSLANSSPTKATFISQNGSPARGRQGGLFNQSSEDNPLFLDAWFLVHCGNPEQGLLGVWIGAPMWPTVENPCPWAFVSRLPDLCAEWGCEEETSHGGPSVRPTPLGPSGPAFDQLDEPAVPIVPKGETHDIVRGEGHEA